MTKSAVELTKFVVFVDGRASLSATQEALIPLLTGLCNELNTSQDFILEAINKVFDSHKGVSFNTDFAVSQATSLLNPPAVAFTATKKRVAEFIKANHQGKKLADGSVERPNSLFISNKGKGSKGLQRRSDLTAEVAAKLQAEAEAE